MYIYIYNLCYKKSRGSKSTKAKANEAHFIFE